nr:bacterial Ig-like domain-containing protein [Lachnospiraceae bacterium]
KKVKDDVVDYCEAEEIGVSYEIKDIKAKNGNTYVRTLNGPLTGTITEKGVSIWLYCSSKKVSLDYQGGSLASNSYSYTANVTTPTVAPSGTKNAKTVYVLYHYHNEYGDGEYRYIDSIPYINNWGGRCERTFDSPAGEAMDFQDQGNQQAYRWNDCGVIDATYGSIWFRTERYKYDWTSTIQISNSVYLENGKVPVLPTPKKDGYIFKGYNTKKDGTGTTYKAGNNVTVADGVTTLYAIWEKPAATKLEVTKPTKTTYFVGEDLDLTGGKAKVTYNYGDPKTVSLTSSMISGYDKTKVGKQTITVTYEGLTGTFEVTVKTPSITGIKVTVPTKTEYFLGEELDITGGKVTAEYDYGEPVTVDLTADMVSGYTRTKLGEQTITVTYEGFTKTFVVTVKAISITKIEVTAPAKTTYLVGENLNLEGGKITVYYDYGNPAEVKLSEGTIIDFDNTKTGKQTLTVIYKEFTATFEVTVASSKMTGIKVTAPTKVEYYVGEDLDLTGGKITVSYDKADSEEIALTESMISGYDKNKVGRQTITVTYDKFTATFAVTVKALPGTYTITYQNCTGAENPNPATYKEGEGLVLLEASKPGARFSYWYIKNGSKEEQITEIPADAKKNYVIYAKWIPYVYKFSFDNNVSSITDYYGGEKTPGVSGTMSPQTINGGSGTMLRNVAYAITGYEFVGWNTETDGSGDDYANREKITYIEGNPETITLYAQWKKISYEIDYVGLSDEEVFAYSLPSEYQIDTETIVFADYKDSVVKEGYNFKGFYKNKKYSTTFKNIPIGSTGNKAVYMKFTANKYKVSYKRNESSIMDFSGTNLKKSGSMSTQTITYGRETALSKNAFKVTGYRFTGWSLSADGSGDTFADKEKVLNLTPENGEVVVLYAQWEKVVYSITYAGLKEGEVDAFGLPTTYVVDSETIKFSDYSGSMFREGYTFKNWYKDKKYQNTMKSIASGSTGNKTVYVKFAANKYKIAYKRNESSIDVPAGTRLRCSGSMSKQTITYDRNTALTKNAFKINGYKFVGWDTEPDGTGIRYTDKEKVLNLTSESGETITLYAQWEKK